MTDKELKKTVLNGIRFEKNTPAWKKMVTYHAEILKLRLLCAENLYNISLSSNKSDEEKEKESEHFLYTTDLMIGFIEEAMEKIEKIAEKEFYALEDPFAAFYLALKALRFMAMQDGVSKFKKD